MGGDGKMGELCEQEGIGEGMGEKQDQGWDTPHKELRNMLYSPSGEEEYPIHNHDLEATRVTRGITSSGKVFEIEDNWKRPGRSTRSIGESWTGCTHFRVKASARHKFEAVNQKG